MEWNNLRGTIKHLYDDGNSRAKTEDDHDRNHYFFVNCRRAMAQDAGIIGKTNMLDEYVQEKINLDSPAPPENFIYGDHTDKALDKWTKWVNSLPQKRKLRWSDKIRLVFAARG